MPGLRTSTQMRARIAGMLRMGFTQSETARKLGVSRDRVRYVALTRDIPVNVAAVQRAMSARVIPHVCGECGRRVREHYGEEG